MKKFFIILTMSLWANSVFGQTKEIITCRIWKTESFCTLPASANVPSGVFYDSASMRVVSCDKLDEKNLVGVWVTFQGINRDGLPLKNQYKSISLIRKKTKEVLHPVAYMERADHARYTPVFMSNESVFEKCVFELKPKEKYDLFIIFETAEVGDKLIIENFLETVIK